MNLFKNSKMKPFWVLCLVHLPSLTAMCFNMTDAQKIVTVMCLANNTQRTRRFFLLFVDSLLNIGGILWFSLCSLLESLCLQDPCSDKSLTLQALRWGAPRRPPRAPLALYAQAPCTSFICLFSSYLHILTYINVQNVSSFLNRPLYICVLSQTIPSA